MSNKLERLSIQERQDFANKYSLVNSLVDRYLVENYSDFVTLLYKDLDNIIRKLERNSELLEKKEDSITIQIVHSLCIMGYDATHEGKYRGNVDISVKDNDYLWLGEAKIYKGPTYLWEGLLQLTTRYTTGRHNENMGGLLIYLFQNNAKRILEDWKAFIDNQNSLVNCTHNDCVNAPPAFYSSFEHEVSGLQYFLRHIPCCFYFNPKDKSAVKSKARKSK